MKKKEKKLLLKAYMQGFNDSFKGDVSMRQLLENAYRLGWIHAVIGDDLTSIDLLSNKEILELIKKSIA